MSPAFALDFRASWASRPLGPKHRYLLHQSHLTRENSIKLAQEPLERSRSLFEHAWSHRDAQDRCSSMLLSHRGAQGSCSSVLLSHRGAPGGCSSMPLSHRDAQDGCSSMLLSHGDAQGSCSSMPMSRIDAQDRCSSVLLISRDAQATLLRHLALKLAFEETAQRICAL